MAKAEHGDAVAEVFETWADARQTRGGALFAAGKRPALPGVVSLTKDREGQIGRALDHGYTAEDLVALVRYAFEADVWEARMWRGEEREGGGEFLGLDNLLRVTKLSDRVDRAREWIATAEDAAEDADPEDGVVFSPIGHLRYLSRTGRLG